MHTPEEFAKTIRVLRASLAQVIRCVDSLTDVAEQMRSETEQPSARGLLRLNRHSFTVDWRDRQCHLGYTLAFRLLEVLARRPDHYLSIDYLLSEIWSGQRSRSAVRSAVSDLRRRLVDAGMDDLAAMIDGSNRGHYGLMLSRR